MPIEERQKKKMYISMEENPFHDLNNNYQDLIAHFYRDFECAYMLLYI